jgi:ABC-type transport system substrate-binding protein
MVAVVLAACLAAGAEVPLFEHEPTDRITLNAQNDNAVLDVRPLDLPGREVPQKPRLSEKLAVRLVDQPDTAYEVQWSAIAKVELFEQRVLEKAMELVKAGRFDDAYDYFKFLQEKYPKTPGLGAGQEDFLFEEAKALHRQQKYDGALAVLRELYGRNKTRADLERALGLTTEKLVEKYAAAQEYQAARQLLRNLAAWYPEHETVKKWEGQFKDHAAAMQAEARKALDAGDLHKADQVARQMAQLWPQLPGAAELIDTLRKKYPRVVVGVMAPAVVGQPDRLGDWAARRSARLVYRTLTEFVGPGTDGGRYRCPMGKMAIEELGRRLAFQLQPGIRWASGDATLTGYDVSRQLLAMADPRAASYRPDWADLLAQVTVRSVYEVDADLQRTHVRPEALLTTILVPSAGSPGAKEGDAINGPYTVLAQTGDETCYVANPRYFAAGPGQPKEIVEKTYAKCSQAVRDLKLGRIDLIDRVTPWELDRLRADAELVVEPYGVPLVHVLVPNLRKPLLAQCRFRRALVYGIHREAILRHLTGGKEVPGCRVVSGPFPIGISHDDPLGYAYDRSLKPREYDPRLAVALARVAWEEVAAGEKKQGKAIKAMPQLTLAHPPGEIARTACQAIQRQLKVVGIPIVLQEIHPGRAAGDQAGFDLAYAEVAMWEPVVDAPRLLGEHGPAGGCSPYMSLALAELERAADWKDVHRVLPRLHRIAQDDVAVVPLWQMVDHFAHRKNLRGVGARPVLLYANVEQWQPTSTAPEKAP